ncbi:hypothetical protein Trco_002273 [Trichoderma cornu-damae]|uniref:Uncharacterized protein n=1 Tax=Trichoderma cornu-damae TaxID=654480 RepID=A0A9P8QUK1_9HYPO|nr:hypothetical protein Trco_002273 [Trichoderma cornu-damae]
MAPPAHDVAELMSRENVGNIPRDQRSLLEGENSWAVDLKDGPQGLATVPSHVLATLKEAFVRLQDESERRNPEHEETPDLPPAVDDLDRRGGYSPGSTPARSSVVPSSSPERSIAWTPSQAGSRDHDEISDPGLPVDETPASKGLAPLTQPPPARAHATPTPTPGPSSSSSSASEPEDLEVELPQAQENSEAPINRVARQAHLTASPREPSSIVASIAATGNTPPCAQPRVASAPGTSSETSKSSALPADAAQRRPRRMKPISFGQDSPKAAVVDPAPFTRTHSVRTFAEPNIHDSAPLSSVTSAPYNDGGIEGFPPPPPPHNFAKYAPPQNRTTRPLDDENRAVGPPDEIGRLPYDGLEASPPRQTHMGQLYRIQAAVDMRIDEHVEPYGAFSATYPDYATVHYGNLIGFIQACVYLEMVQEKRVIREYLYDDFIRAWSGGYVRYANRAAQNPLSAIEWFNSIRGPILFNRMRVNNDNIATIVNAYPEEVARFRALMNKEERQDETPAPEPEMELELEAEPGNEPEKEQGAEIRGGREARRDAATAENTTSYEAPAPHEKAAVSTSAITAGPSASASAPASASTAFVPGAGERRLWLSAASAETTIAAEATVEIAAPIASADTPTTTSIQATTAAAAAAADAASTTTIAQTLPSPGSRPYSSPRPRACCSPPTGDQAATQVDRCQVYSPAGRTPRTPSLEQPRNPQLKKPADSETAQEVGRGAGAAEGAFPEESVFFIDELDRQ